MFFHVSHYLGGLLINIFEMEYIYTSTSEFKDF
jgi:hypothetical protein